MEITMKFREDATGEIVERSVCSDGPGGGRPLEEQHHVAMEFFTTQKICEILRAYVAAKHGLFGRPHGFTMFQWNEAGRPTCTVKMIRNATPEEITELIRNATPEEITELEKKIGPPAIKKPLGKLHKLRVAKGGEGIRVQHDVHREVDISGTNAVPTIRGDASDLPKKTWGEIKGEKP